MNYQNLLSVIDSLNDTYCSLWETVCNIESPTACKAGVDAVGDVFVQLAKKRGWRVDVLRTEKAGNPICITLNPDVQAAPVVFSGHIDTVHPVGSFGNPAVHTDAERIYGPGVMDCKGGVVASFMALDALDKCGFTARPVKLIIQTDEETGSKTSDKQTIAFMLDAAKDAVAFLNTEGIQGETAVLQRKGILRYQFTVCGKAVHSSKCTAGANAVCEAAHKIIQLETMKDPDGLTCNCGVIYGGTVANSVAEQCTFFADIRFANQEQYDAAVEMCEKVAKISTIDGCVCRLEKVSDRPAMPLVDKNVALLKEMNEIYEQSGLFALKARACLSGSDAAYTTQADIPTVDNLGVDGGNIHSVNEYAYLNSLAASAKRLAVIAYGI